MQYHQLQKTDVTQTVKLKYLQWHTIISCKTTNSTSAMKKKKYFTQYDLQKLTSQCIKWNETFNTH